MKAHFVTFNSPGTFFAEQTTKSIDSWDVETAKQMAKEIVERVNATPYGFYFTTRERGPNDLDSHETARSVNYFLGGTVETLEQVKARSTDKESILISNMEINRWNRIITNNNSWRFTLPFADDDVLLEWPQPDAERA